MLAKPPGGAQGGGDRGRDRRVRAIGMGEALAWSAFWIILALVFNVAIFFIYEHNWMGVGYNGIVALDGRTAALQFFTGYLVEKSLSLDNIFVIAFCRSSPRTISFPIMES